MLIIKKNGTKQPYDKNRIVIAIQKSAAQTGNLVSEDDMTILIDKIENRLTSAEELSVDDVHDIVNRELSYCRHDVASQYRNYRTHKKNQNAIVNLLEKLSTPATPGLTPETITELIRMKSKYPNESPSLVLYRMMDNAIYTESKAMLSVLNNPNNIATILNMLMEIHITEK